MADTETAEAGIKDYLQPLAPHEEGVSEGAVVSIVDQAEINQQIATARRYPRSIHQFRRRLYEMVTIDVDTADSCIYAIPRDGKMIDGPSIRFAELLIAGWGNNRAAAEVSHIDEEFVVASGVFYDLETNAAIQGKVMRRITGKPSKDFPKGKRFSQDMIAVTGNAACSIALRNAILRGVPKALWKDIFDEAKKVAAGDAKTFIGRRDAVIKALGVQGATPDAIFALLEIKGPEDMTTEHLVHLKGLHNAIKDGETTLEDAFRKPDLKPGEAVPPRPSQSAFAREDRQPPPEQKKSDQKIVVDPKPAEPQQPKETEAILTRQAAMAAEQASQGNDEDAAAKREEERQDWVKDAHKALAGLAKVRDVNDLRKETLDAGVMTAQEEKSFDAACDGKVKEIMDAATAARKKR